MLSALEVELQILTLAGTPVVDPSRGCPMKVTFLRRLIPDTSDTELIGAIKRLFAGGFLDLRTWDDEIQSDRDYRGGREDDEQFFYGRQGFCVKPTPTSASYLKELEVVAKSKNRLGF